MYHEVTYQDLQKRRTKRLWWILLAIATCAVAAVVYVYAQAIAREQGAATLRQAIISSALQCCAVEGSFPTSIEHLTEHYGLVVNEADYQVTYQWLGDNVTPSVVVTLR